MRTSWNSAARELSLGYYFSFIHSFANSTSIGQAVEEIKHIYYGSNIGYNLSKVMAAAQALGENLWREVAVLWSIKGYHFFKIRAHESISMLVLPEEANARDPSAMKVMMPEDVPAELLDKNTREGDSKHPQQKVRDIIEKKVGRVPANLCRVFRRLVETEMLVDGITCNYGGTVRQTIDPVFYQRFERARTRFGRD